tara:strand:+ start:307 stop:2745 length:2439 start_codon:yes stop_codon:yes gene_type:complete
MPQNDRSQIDQIRQEYESSPAKGLAHGVQKDAIQNGIGARTLKSVAKACKKDWKFNFELVEINGKSALTFWDEGTSGLTGKIRSSHEIESQSVDGGLGADHANEKLSRFLSRFESGGNTGPGSFGRGKLIFQAASGENSLLIESFRSDDAKYIALNRLIEGNSLKQPNLPYIDSMAREFINKESDGVLSPLENYGTRITILDVDAEIVNAFQLSFTDQDSDDSLYHMISETWWEIIKMGAQINLIQNGNTLAVKLTDDLDRIIEAEDGEGGFRVLKKENIPVVLSGGLSFQIKELKLVVSPDTVPDYFNEIWVQRKKMKIGCIKKGINIHGKISNKLSGFLRLDDDLEDEFERAEGTTHYAFSHKRSALKEVREIIKKEVDELQRRLGYRSENTEGKIKNELNNALTDLNEMAADLGIPTEFGQGKKEPMISLNIASLDLPNEGTTRVDFGQEIGPIEYQISNKSESPLVGKLVVSFEQGGTTIKEVFSQPDIIVNGSATQSIKVGKLVLNRSDYLDQSMMLIKAKFFKKDSDNLYAQVSRSIWIGIDPPERTSYLCDLKLQHLMLPRKDTKRVELGELIKDVAFTISNTENKNLNLNIDVKIRKSKTSNSDVIELLSLVEERDYEISALSDCKFPLGNIEVNQNVFGTIFDDIATAENRKCELFYSVRYAQTYKDLNVQKGEHACNKKTQEFYCGVDPAGQSIFKQVLIVSDEDDHRRASTSGSTSEGYNFILNNAHPSFKWVQERDSEIREDYFQEQMIYHACKLAIKDEVFEGPLSSFREKFVDTELPPHEVAESFDEIVGMILKKLKA